MTDDERRAAVMCCVQLSQVQLQPLLPAWPKTLSFCPLREISRLFLTLGEQYIGLSDYGTRKAKKTSQS